MKKLVETFLAWLERNARSAREREVEHYLAQSSDLADLELRLQRLMRRGELLR